jgi:Putative S-adenosyl-L-methionine-dependent methyltransferase
MARYMVTNYKLSLYPYYDLLIYEMGAGNGTLMLNILDYIQREHPEVYDRTRFRIIEISTSLAKLQASQLKQTASTRGHADKVEIINKSIFDWDTYISSPCFFLALEVFDNFAHDCIRYDIQSGAPLQGYVLVDQKGDFFDFYDYKLDPIATRYLQMRDLAVDQPYNHPLGSAYSRRRGGGGGVWKKLKTKLMLPGGPSLSQPEYIPTRLMQFFDILHNYFPAHKLLSSDFDRLPNAVPGINAPVVQTRYKRRTVPVTTPLVSCQS